MSDAACMSSWRYGLMLMMSCVQSCTLAMDHRAILCITPSLKDLKVELPIITKVSFILDGYSTGQVTLMYVEDPKFEEFEKPTLTSKGNRNILEIKVKQPTSSQ